MWLIWALGDIAHHIKGSILITSRDLCIQCHEANSPETREFSAAIPDAHCQYCAGQLCGSGTDFLALVTGIQKLKFMCMPCSMEHNRFLRQQLKPDASALSQKAQLTLLRKLDEQVDEHMKQWVLKRARDAARHPPGPNLIPKRATTHNSNISFFQSSHCRRQAVACFKKQSIFRFTVIIS